MDGGLNHGRITAGWCKLVHTPPSSWSGGSAPKGGEVWSAATGTWRTLPGVPVTTTMTADPAGPYRADNHQWLYATSGGRVLHLGPSRQMNWITTSGDGTITPAGNRADSADAMNGNAGAYDIGKLLTLGGAPAYDNTRATRRAYTVDVSGGAQPVTARTDDMAYARSLSSSGGGGLCGECATNHADGAIFTPPYLLNADGTEKSRPAITAGVPSRAGNGTKLTVTTDSAVTSFVLVRTGAVTHSTDHDQRRVPLTSRQTSPNAYEMTIPADPGTALPGTYMLFALNAQGVPSRAKMLTIG
jgi:galactose oxidase